MVTRDILTIVLRLRRGNEEATGFAIEVDGSQYIVTARHLFNAPQSPTLIDVFRHDSWVTYPVSFIHVATSTVDIAVLKINGQIFTTHPNTLGVAGAKLSQRVFFVGFPFGLSIDGLVLNNGFPLPLVKHGIIASMPQGDGPFFVDGINNPGFSGGPVVLDDGNLSRPTIIGVVSGYRWAQEPVFHEGRQSPDLSVQSNTGLLVAFSVDHAVRAIKKDAAGPP